MEEIIYVYSMNIYLATDHAGFALKEEMKRFLITCGTSTEPEFSVVDFGAYKFDGEDDYPDFISRAAQAVQVDREGRGIIFGGSGQGEAICANRYKGVRAVVYYGDGLRTEDGKVYDIIALSREHNDANILSIGARFVDEDKIFLAVHQWLHMSFTNQERHVRRIEKLDAPK